MSVENEIRELNYKRLQAVEAGRAILDRARAERRSMTAEEEAAWNRSDADVTRLDRERDQLLSSDRAKHELEFMNEEFRRAVTPSYIDERTERENEVMRRFMSGEIPRVNIDLRAASYTSEAYRQGARGSDLFESRGLYSDSGGGSLVIPSLVASQIYSVMLSKNVMRQTRAQFHTTPNGDPLSVPVGSQGAATQIASENTQLGGTDPTLATKVLHAYRLGELVTVSNSLISDAGFSILDFVASSIGGAIATKQEQWMVSGTGSGQPTGIMSSAAAGTGSAGTIAAGTLGGLATAGVVVEKLVDVMYSVNSAYRQVGEWIAHDNTVASLRKIRVGSAGTLDAFAWSPSPTAGMINGTPDTFLGRPIHASSNVASMASDAMVLGFGDFNAYYAREAGGLTLETSRDLKFDYDQLAIRGILRTDSSLLDPTAFNRLHQANS